MYRKLAFTAVLVIGFAISLYLWGIPLVVQLGGFWQQFGANTPSEIADQTNNSTIISPRLNPLPSTVNSLDQIVISGTAPAGFDVAIFINDEKQVTVLSDASGNFEVKDLKLNEGDNTIYAKTIAREQESDSSNVQLVNYDTTPPKLSIIQPANGSTVSEDKVTVVGNTEPQARLTINDMQVIVNATTGDFSREISLQEGSNRIKLEAVDRAGNTTVIEITINREESSESEE